MEWGIANENVIDPKEVGLTCSNGYRVRRDGAVVPGLVHNIHIF